MRTRTCSHFEITAQIRHLCKIPLNAKLRSAACCKQNPFHPSQHVRKRIPRLAKNGNDLLAELKYRSLVDTLSSTAAMQHRHVGVVSRLTMAFKREVG